ncbi:LGFP repeat-containing protein [Corynebacterium hindlerae]|uniref:LGFP repeat-containing protein n=1 Tax=Corynebacterium hindlerae TaxID=699041 RepID=UPI001AD6A47B|nr:LGFP repeat-containing protein [Corynebacterium hindlerae]QTH58820.1 LGFP repeat-containing protein [Corynebacterium hindlerae]
MIFGSGESVADDEINQREFEPTAVDRTIDNDSMLTIEGPFSPWGIPTPPGAENYRVNELESGPIERGGELEWHPTEDPKGVVIEGKMRSDRELIPAGFSDSEADKSEVLEHKYDRSVSGNYSLQSGCGVYWPSPFEVCGAIKSRYDGMGGPKSFLSFPKTNELANPDGVGRRSEFINGFIYWHPEVGAHPVSIPASVAWARNGWELGYLGYPTSGDQHLGNMWFKQEFEGGQIYTHNALPISQASVRGAILEKWKTMGAENGELGFPISDELSTPDDRGKYSVFEGGMIYWTPDNGAHAVQGALLAGWSYLGYEKSSYGFPKSDEYLDSEIQISQDFEGGALKVKDFVKSDKGLTESNGKYIDVSLVNFIRNVYGVNLLQEVQLDGASATLARSFHNAIPPENGSLIVRDEDKGLVSYRISSPVAIYPEYVFDPSGERPTLHDYCTAPSPQFWLDKPTLIAADLRGPCSYHDLCYERNPDDFATRSQLCDPALQRDWRYVCKQSYSTNVTPCRAFVDSAWTTMRIWQIKKNL